MLKRDFNKAALKFYWNSTSTYFLSKIRSESCFLFHRFYCFRVNLHSILAWMSRKSLLETGAISEVTLRHGCSPVNFLYIFRTPFYRNTSGRLIPQFLHYSRKFEFALLLLVFRNVDSFITNRRTTHRLNMTEKHQMIGIWSNPWTQWFFNQSGELSQ